ncbi:DUF4913 domain-containing protein [Streptomyces sp. NPDC090445]|uniref:DUF4913 domain-containing protein n=1 Tax=Streptomyces sp. NPDC090445 TaxID=3365963 RepID=UPI00382312A4
MDDRHNEWAQRVAAQVTAEASTEAWTTHHATALSLFLTGARTSHEQKQREEQVAGWHARLTTAHAADAFAEVARLQGELCGWIMVELGRSEDALAALKAAFPLPRPRIQGRSLFPMPASEVRAGGEPEFYFPDVVAFVSDYLAPMVRRPLDGVSATWCARWWEHPEAGSRLSALWLAWEHLRHEPALGISAWWIQHADPHLRVLMDPKQGPFAGCSPAGGHAEPTHDPLPVDPYDPV